VEFRGGGGVNVSKDMEKELLLMGVKPEKVNELVKLYNAKVNGWVSWGDFKHFVYEFIVK
jgi:hypothetical protein